MRKLVEIIIAALLLIQIGIVQAQETAFVYLSDFIIKRDHIIYQGVGVALDHPWNKPEKKITINGVEYDKGVGTTANWGESYIEYALNGQFTTLTAVVGLDDYAIYDHEADLLQYPFEWIMIDTAGNFIRQYRGCSENYKPDECDAIDYNIPYFPKNNDNINDDHNNQWVDYYLNNTPDRKIVMTRAACSASVLLDDAEVYNTGNLTRSENFNSPAQSIEIDLTEKNTLKLDIIADGYQHEPFEDSILVKKCPWRDMVNWADAKLYYEKSVTGITVDEKEIIMDALNTAYIRAEVYPSDAKMTAYKIESSDPDIVEVKNEHEGRLWSKKSGKAIITVRTIDGNFKDSCEVFVNGVISSVNTKEVEELKIINPVTPAHISIQISSDLLHDCSLYIYNLQGKLIWESNNIESKSMSLNLTGLVNTGMYLINLQTTKKTISKKIVLF